MSAPWAHEGDPGLPLPPPLHCAKIVRGEEWEEKQDQAWAAYRCDDVFSFDSDVLDPSAPIIVHILL